MYHVNHTSRNRPPKARDHRAGPRIRLVGLGSLVARDGLEGTGLPRPLAIFETVGLGLPSARITRGKIRGPFRLFSGVSSVHARKTSAKGGRTPTWLRDDILTKENLGSEKKAPIRID